MWPCLQGIAFGSSGCVVTCRDRRWQRAGSRGKTTAGCPAASSTAGATADARRLRAGRAPSPSTFSCVRSAAGRWGSSPRYAHPTPRVPFSHASAFPRAHPLIEPSCRPAAEGAAVLANPSTWLKSPPWGGRLSPGNFSDCLPDVIAASSLSSPCGAERHELRPLSQDAAAAARRTWPGSTRPTTGRIERAAAWPPPSPAAWRPGCIAGWRRT